MKNELNLLNIDKIIDKIMIDEVILMKLIKASRSLSELKGISQIIPNESILINTLTLQEAKDSSAIENIISTDDEVYQSDFNTKVFVNSSTQEVHKYSNALIKGYKNVSKKGFIAINDLIEIQSLLVENKAGIRKLPGTVLKNESTGVVIYTPPQSYNDIIFLLKDLEKFINEDKYSTLDPLIKMSIIHYQFESIHPFYDGNGRTGRILNILYLVKSNLLNIPILYLSRYINENKQTYYKLFQELRTKNIYKNWILFMLDSVEKTSQRTIKQIIEIKNLMQVYKNLIREKLPKIYSQDLINNIFKHPYTKISFIENDLKVSRKTAIKYLNLLVEIKLLSKIKIKNQNFYLNKKLFDLLKS